MARQLNLESAMRPQSRPQVRSLGDIDGNTGSVSQTYRSAVVDPMVCGWKTNRLGLEDSHHGLGFRNGRTETGVQNTVRTALEPECLSGGRCTLQFHERLEPTDSCWEGRHL